MHDTFVVDTFAVFCFLFEEDESRWSFQCCDRSVIVVLHKSLYTLETSLSPKKSAELRKRMRIFDFLALYSISNMICPACRRLFLFLPCL